jgi:hypothetical protein
MKTKYSGLKLGLIKLKQISLCLTLYNINYKPSRCIEKNVSLLLYLFCIFQSWYYLVIGHP